MFHACRDLARSRDLNDKASSGQCTTFKTKTRARIAGLVNLYNAWHHTLPQGTGCEFHSLTVEACLSEDVSTQALENGAGAIDAEHAPLPLILLSIRSTDKSKRAREHRAIKTNEVCALHAELLDRIGGLAIASKPLPAEIAGADSRLRWGWQRALLDERERLKRILNEWKGRFGKDAAFRIAAADINRRNAILAGSEDTRAQEAVTDSWNENWYGSPCAPLPQHAARTARLASAASRGSRTSWWAAATNDSVRTFGRTMSSSAGSVSRRMTCCNSKSTGWSTMFTTAI
jgi:hypothetical protein